MLVVKFMEDIKEGFCVEQCSYGSSMTTARKCYLSKIKDMNELKNS